MDGVGQLWLGWLWGRILPEMSNVLEFSTSGSGRDGILTVAYYKHGE